MDETALQAVNVIVTAAAGLIGVALGGWITSRGLRQERR
jgi:hypothetical protein